MSLVLACTQVVFHDQSLWVGIPLDVCCTGEEDLFDDHKLLSFLEDYMKIRENRLKDIACHANSPDESSDQHDENRFS